MHIPNPIASAMLILLTAAAAQAQVASAGSHAPMRPTSRAGPRVPLFPEVLGLTGRGPEAATLGDFDGDGRQDLAVPNLLDATISIVFGRAHGFLESGVSIPASASPRHVAVGDVDSDGDLDLAVVCDVSGVRIFANAGDGTFTAGATYVTGREHAWVELSLLDGDDDLDMVVANAGDDSVSVLLGNGDGTFQAPVALAAGSGPSSIAIGDLNEDSVADIVVGNGAGTRVSVFLGVGDGTFGTQQIFNCGDDPRSVTLADLNGDGHLDVAVANATTGRVSMLFGAGDGTLGSGAFYDTGWLPLHLAVGDLEHDGDVDLVVTTDPKALLVFVNLGNGTFAGPQSYMVGEVSLAIALRGATIADFDADGQLDVAVFAHSGTPPNGYGFVTVIRGAPSKLGALEALPVSPACGLKGKLARLDADDHLDLATVDRFTNSVRVARGSGTGTFSGIATYPIPFTRRPVSLACGRLDADAHLDLVVGTENTGGTTTAPGFAYVLHGRGDGTFDSPQSLPVGGQPKWIDLGDLDGDGDLDLAVVGKSLSLYSFLNNGIGSLVSVPAATAPMGGEPLLLSLVHLDRDNSLDAIVVDGLPSGDSALVRRGNGNGTFGALQSSATSVTRGYSGAVGDVNGDGELDVVRADEFASIQVVLGNGDGTFGTSFVQSVPGVLDFPSIAIADLDLDGNADLIARWPGLTVFRGHGDGTFDAPEFYYAPSNLDGISLGDLDSDGDLDVVGGTASLAFTSLNRTNP